MALLKIGFCKLYLILLLVFPEQLNIIYWISFWVWKLYHRGCNCFVSSLKTRVCRAASVHHFSWLLSINICCSHHHLWDTPVALSSSLASANSGYVPLSATPPTAHARAKDTVIQIFRWGLSAKACQPREHTFSVGPFFPGKILKTAAAKKKKGQNYFLHILITSL